MKRAAIFLSVALAVSIGANMYLLTSRSRTASGGVHASRRGSAASPAARAAAASSAAPGRADIAEAAGDRCPEALESRDESLTTCSGKLAQTGKERARYLPLPQRFKRGAPNPQAVARIRPLVKAAFGGHMPAHDLSCRGDACRLDVLLPQGKSFANAMRNLQGPAMRGAVAGISFETAEPTFDPATGDALTHQVVYLGLSDVHAADGHALLSDVIERFEAGGAAWRCYQGNPAKGVLLLRLDIGDPGASGIVLHVGGDLAATAAGRCLADGMRAVAAAEPIPPKVNGAVAFYRVTLPPAGAATPRVAANARPAGRLAAERR